MRPHQKLWAALLCAAIAACNAAPKAQTDAAAQAQAPVAPVPPTGFALASMPPGATVFLDGHRVGTTPLRLTDVVPGRHQVRLQANGYSPWEVSVQATRGVILDLPSAQMTTASASTEQAPPLAAPVPTPASVPPPAPAKPRIELSELPWKKGSFPRDFELRFGHGGTHDGVTTHLRASRARGGVVQQIRRFDLGETKCTAAVSEAALAHFGFDEVIDVLTKSEGFRMPWSPGRAGVIACDFGESLAAHSLRAHGVTLTHELHGRAAAELAFRGQRVTDALTLRHPLDHERISNLHAAIESCIEHPAGIEIEYVAPRKGGAGRIVRLGADAHSRRELGCIRSAFTRAQLPTGRACDLHSSIYVRNKKYRLASNERDLSVVRLHAKGPLDDVRVGRGTALVISERPKVLLVPARPQELGLYRPSTRRAVWLKIDPKRGREHAYVVDERALR